MSRPVLSPPFPILPLRSGVLFPESPLSLTVGRERSVALVDALKPGDLFAVVTQRDPRVDDPVAADFQPVGTVARLVQVLRGGRDAMRVTVEGVGRLAVDRVTGYEPFLQGEGRTLEDERADSAEAKILAEELAAALSKLSGKSGQFEDVLRVVNKPSAFADKVASALGLEPAQALEILTTLDVPERLRKVLRLVAEQEELASLRQKIGEDVRRELGKNQREHILREQLKAIKKELGEDKGDDADKLRSKLDAADLPADVREVVDRELDRLEATGGQGAEANVIRTYLEWIAALPWSKRAESHTDIDRISQKLDADHSGLEDVKKRILEHMAVHRLSQRKSGDDAGKPSYAKGTILCLVGPPGVGKTSLGQSIADATGRPFVRISLGGVRDEAEIRGHRRTYVGALPGRILHGLRKAGAKNPVLLLDEIDKLSQHFGPAAESALLEVLDPEQNKTFTDHYLELPFDLSEVMFLCTANTLETLSAPLRDRLEIVELAGYTPPEKLDIARRHLVPKRLREAGVPSEAVTFTDEALLTIVSSYTREAGVRQLDREIGRVARHAALEVARQTDDTIIRITVDTPELSRILGKSKYRADVAERTALPGVATGLAWTPVGGDILFIETSRMKGKGRLEITGQLGDVMKESARAALTYVKSHADDLGISVDALEEADVHIHVPAGAVPKDGPSAGVTMFTALTSLFTGRRVRGDTAMTGECTLRGRVLPVGGIKSKVLAAHRAGIKRVILPRDNERDFEDVPADVQKELEVVYASDMRDVLAAALEETPTVLPTPGSDASPLAGH
ncbi:MAG TPA: endopeptidase La [Polyangiaceae bacterium]|nr:endopeptidase La [Polyangiaceae bacterium]